MANGSVIAVKPSADGKTVAIDPAEIADIAAVIMAKQDEANAVLNADTRKIPPDQVETHRRDCDKAAQFLSQSQAFIDMLMKPVATDVFQRNYDAWIASQTGTQPQPPV